jgi:hypothetical protein
MTRRSTARIVVGTVEVEVEPFELEVPMKARLAEWHQNKFELSETAVGNPKFHRKKDTGGSRERWPPENAIGWFDRRAFNPEPASSWHLQLH